MAEPGKPEQRNPLNGWLALQDKPLITKQIKSDDWDKKQQLAVGLKGFYRGQLLDSELPLTKLDPYLVVQRFEPPPPAFLAARMAEDFTYGAISIVMDTSGSMNWKFPAVKTKNEKGEDDLEVGNNGNVLKGKVGNTRYYYALKALKEVLEGLPDGMDISTLALNLQPVIRQMPRPNSLATQQLVIQISGNLQKANAIFCCRRFRAAKTTTILRLPKQSRWA